MKVSRMALICVWGLALVAGCAKTEDEPAQVNSKATTEPTVTDSTGQKASTPSAEPAPTASMLLIDRAPQWFPPARLRLKTTDDGKVVARLYTDDPRDMWSGKQTVNSYDLKMELTNIADPADIAKGVWIEQNSSMDRQDSPYGIFLDKQHQVLQPMNVEVTFDGKAPRVKAFVAGTFGLYPITDQMTHPAPSIVTVRGVLDATVETK